MHCAHSQFIIDLLTSDTTPPKTVLRSGRPTLLEAGFVPAAIIHLGAEGSAATPTLSRECLETAQSALHAEVAIAEKRW